MDSGEFEAMLAADEDHWWYRGRRRIVRSELDRLALPAGALILDAGCGSGRMLDELVDYGRVAGIDASPRGVEAARARGHADVQVGSVDQLPYPDSLFDLVTSLDVIEHVHHDERALRELWRVTRPGGYLLATVPAYRWLWSAHDVVNQHYRRYGGADLRAVATGAGWTPLRITHFNALLLAPAAIVRLWHRHSAAPAGCSDLARTPARLNDTLELALRAEARLLRTGARIPIGLSLLGVFQKSLSPVPAAEPVSSVGLATAQPVPGL